MLILGIAKLRHFRQIYLSKAVNAHDDFRGLYLLGRLGSRRPRIPNKIKSPTFFYALKSEKEISNRNLGLGQRLKKIKI